jgi:cytochrome d ubiquinol oxidase subunit II
MIDAAFVILALMIVTYVLLDGFDLGAAVVAPLVSRDDDGRGEAMHAIGPYWNGNEVWLVASGAVLFALFPRAYASAFSGFYLPFMVVLWLLMFRGISIEVRGHIDSSLWRTFWDNAFSWSSGLLIFIFGVSLGNLVRGLPLNAHGYFFGTFAYLLNAYAVLVGAFAVAALGLHGAIFLSLRGGEAVRGASRALASRAWWLVIGAYVAISAATFVVRPSVTERPWLVGLVLVVSIPALVVVRVALARGAPGPAFIASSAYLATLLAAAAATIYPYLLPAFPAGQGGLTIYAAATAAPALASGLAWTIAGVVAVAVYTGVVAGRIERGRP